MACGGLFSTLGMLLGIDVLLLLLVVAAGSKSGGGGTETCEGSEGDLITEALTDATAGRGNIGRKLILPLLCFSEIHIGSNGIKAGENERVRDVAC